MFCFFFFSPKERTNKKVTLPPPLLFFVVVISDRSARIRMQLYARGWAHKVDVVPPMELGGLKTPEYLAINPLGKMPTLLLPDGNSGAERRRRGGYASRSSLIVDVVSLLAVIESEVIQQYLASTLADSDADRVSLLPKGSDPLSRAKMDEIIRLHDVYFSNDQAAMYRAMDVGLRAEKIASIANLIVREGGRGMCVFFSFPLSFLLLLLLLLVFFYRSFNSRTSSQTVLETLASRSDGPFLLGSELTFADCTWFPSFIFMTFILPRYFGWGDVFANKPRLAVWWAATNAHPAGERVFGEVNGGLRKWEEVREGGNAIGSLMSPRSRLGGRTSFLRIYTLEQSGRWEKVGIIEQLKSTDLQFAY